VLLDGNKAADEDHMFELTAETCKKWFNGQRFGRIGTIGDGSCFFHSLCLSLNIAGYRSNERKKIAYALRKALSDSFKKEDYDKIIKEMNTLGKHKSFEEIKEGLENPKIWAEEIMIRWSSKFLGANVIFINLSDNKNAPYCGVHDEITLIDVKRCTKPGIPTIIVGWVNSSHFELLARIDDIGEDVKVRTAFDPQNSTDLKTIQNLMKSYKAHCRV